MDSIYKGKVCSKCGKYKALHYFSEDGRGGLRNDCKECAAKQQRQIRDNMTYIQADFKDCPRCGRTREIHHFAKDNTKKCGHASLCKDCQAEARRWRNRARLLGNPASKLY